VYWRDSKFRKSEAMGKLRTAILPARIELRLLALMLVLVVAVGASALLVGPRDSAEAALFCINDSAGANDEPGQKDLTQMCFESPTGTPLTQHITWNWDELGTSGANSLDACALFDTDTDGNANFAVCENTNNNPAVHFDTITYTCNDTRADRCAGKQNAPGDASMCSVTQTNTDPFPEGDFVPRDVTADCNVVLSDVGATSSVLLNVCSYPSGEPNSDPSDCVVAPDLPTLTLVKVVTNDNGGTRTVADFPLTATGPTTITGVSGTAAVTSVRVNPGTYVLSETTQTGYTASAWSCTAGTLTGSSLVLSFAQNATCTITNDDQAATLIVTKVVTNDNGGTKVCADFSFSVNAAVAVPFEADCSNQQTVNAGTYNITEPAVAGYTTTFNNCSNVVIPNGGSATCTITNNDNISVPTFSTLIVPNDQATLGNFVTGAPNAAAATITFNLYGPTDPTCAGTPAYTQTITGITAGGTYVTTNTTFAIPLTGTGVWRWSVAYSGDQFNAPAESACGTERFTVAYGLPE
jgi:hypothetical protein